MESRPDGARRRPTRPSGDVEPRPDGARRGPSGDDTRSRRVRPEAPDARDPRPRHADDSHGQARAETRPDGPRPDGQSPRRRARPESVPPRHDAPRRRPAPGTDGTGRDEAPRPGPRQRSSGEIHTRDAEASAEPRAPRRRPSGERPAGERPARRRPAEQTSDGPRAGRKRPTADTAARKRTPDRPTEARPTEARPTEARPTEDRRTEDRRTEDADRAGQRPARGRPSSRRRPAGDATAGDVTAGKRRAPRPDTPAEKTRPETAPGPAAAPGTADTESTTDSPPPRRRGRMAGLSGGRLGRGLVALVSVAVLLGTGYVWRSVDNLDSDITRLAGLGLGNGSDGAVDILLVGTDSRADAKGNPLTPQELRMLKAGDEVATNTDTILLIRVPNDGSSATAISIPRDSYVDVPGIGRTKINAAYGATRESVRRKAVESGTDEADAEREGTGAGRKALIDTVAGLTGVEVDHYAEVGLLGFVLLTNAVGGVDVCLKNPVNEPMSGARFKAGRQTLNGSQALSFVRQRHELPRGDLDRITRQQVYMASLTQKILSAGTLTDPGKLNELQNAVSRSVIIDDDWDVLTFVEQLKDLSGGRVKFATIPVLDDHGWSEDGQQSVVTVDPTQVKAFTSNLLDPSRNTGRGEYTVDVVNAGTVDGLAANVSGLLTAKGYQAGATSSTPTNDRDSVVYAREADDPGARLLAKDLGGLTVRADPSMPENRIRAVLTNTYDGTGSVSDVGANSPDTSDQASTPAAANRAAITANSDGPTCVN
ncbi:LCP family glycopolymer transferase [Gordonia sp. NPDC003376]